MCLEIILWLTSQPIGKIMRNMRKWFLVAIAILTLITLFVLNASIHGRQVVGCLEGCGNPADRQTGGLRVVSLNMLHGIPRFTDLDVRVKLISAELRRLDGDVIILQEVPWRLGNKNIAETLAQALGYNYMYLRANGNKNMITFEEGEAILSRFPLKDVVHAELVPRVDLFQHRVVLGATSVTPWGEVRLFGTHLTHNDPQLNQGQVEALRQFVEANSTGFTVVAGDFNAWEDTPQIEKLTGSWTDTYRQAHPGDAGLTCCIDELTNPDEALEMRIDYIFLVNFRGELIRADHAFYSPFRAGEGWQWALDHTGLVVEVMP
jgi:endonuclease/exonuclease/phosphatase family metal-dependent hydrolase